MVFSDVPINILLTFNKLKALTTDIHIIREAVRSSAYLEVLYFKYFLVKF